MNAIKTVILFSLTTILLIGCTLGFKSWPEPHEQQDKFTWHSVTPRFEGDCLVIEGRLNGAFDNLLTVYLKLEPLGEAACASCPFKPSRTIELRVGDSGFQLIGPWMKIQLCTIDTSIPHRLVLVGINRHKGLAPVTSEIVRIDP